MAQLSLPPGFGFHPTDEELVAYYLRRKVHGQKIDLDIIPEVDLYKCEPWDLPEKSKMQSKDSRWHFFSPRDRKYPNGSRTNRATEAGYWKATGKDRKVTSQKRVIGTKKTLVFHRGRAPSGKRTDWVMHEYRIEESECHGSKDMKDSFVLCRVFKKNGFHVKNDGDASKPIAGCMLALVSNNVSAEDHSKGSLSPNTDDCAETKPTLLIETPENTEDGQEDMFSPEEWLKLLQADPEPDNTSRDESSKQVQDPSETEAFAWSQEAFAWSQIVSLGDTNLESLQEEEILKELYRTVQKSQGNNCRQDGFQDEDLSKVFDYFQQLDYDFGSFEDEDPGHDTTGIVLRSAKHTSGEDMFSESTSVGKLRLQLGRNENDAEKQDKEHLEYYTEDNLTTDDYICALQEQEILLGTLDKQKEIMSGNHGRVVPAEPYLNSGFSGNVLASVGIGQPYQSQPLPTNAFGSSGNHHTSSKAEFLQGTENAETTIDNASHGYSDVSSGRIHNHIVSSTHSITWVMSAGSAEVVESVGAVPPPIESEVTRDEKSKNPAVEDLKEPDDFRSSSSTKASPSAAGSGHSGNSRRTKGNVTHRKFLARKHRTGNGGGNSDNSLHEHDEPCDGKGQSGANAGSCLEEASKEFNSVSLSRGAPSSPTSVITFLCFLFLGTTVLLFLLYRGMLRVARVLSTFNF